MDPTHVGGNAQASSSRTTPELAARRSPLSPVTIIITKDGDRGEPSDAVPSPSTTDSDSESSVDMEEDEQAEAVVAELNIQVEARVPLSATFVRFLALLCACSLSIGSH